MLLLVPGTSVDPTPLNTAPMLSVCAAGRGVSGWVVPPEGHKVLSALADLPGGAEPQQPAGRARVLVGSAALLATAAVELSAEAEAHMASVQVSLPACRGNSAARVVSSVEQLSGRCIATMFTCRELNSLFTQLRYRHFLSWHNMIDVCSSGAERRAHVHTDRRERRGGGGNRAIRPAQAGGTRRHSCAATAGRQVPPRDRRQPAHGARHRRAARHHQRHGRELARWQGCGCQGTHLPSSSC